MMRSGGGRRRRGGGGGRREGGLRPLEGVDRLSQFWPVIMWDVASVAKSTGGVRLVGPEAGTRGEETLEKVAQVCWFILKGHFDKWNDNHHVQRSAVTSV